MYTAGPASLDSWITVSREGNTVMYTAQANPGAERTGTVVFGPKEFPITQDGAPPCSASVSPSSLLFGSAADSRDVQVGGAPTCPFTVSDDRDWISVSASSVSGGGSVTVSVTANTSTQSRSGTVTIGGASVPVTQAPCSTSVSPSSLSFGSAAGSQDVQVGGSSSCSFPVSDNRDWISVSKSSVSGGGSVTVSVTANSGSSQRSGTVTIGGASVSVAQTGASQPTNRPPVAVADTATTSPGTPVIVAVLANDTDPDGDSLSVSAIATPPTHGMAGVGADLQTVLYSPGPTRTGEDSFTYRVSDGNGGTADATVTVTVQPSTSPNQPPTANAGPDQTVAQGVTVTLDGTGSSDADGDALSYYWHQDAGPEVTFDNRAVVSPTFTAPVVPGDRRLIFRLVVSDLGGPDVSEDTVTITVIDTALIGHRDRLLLDYAARKGYEDNACWAWDSRHPSAQDVFIWNTHRLHRSGMLQHVTELHAFYGKDGESCGGAEHNRTFMAMNRELQSQLVKIHDGYVGAYPAWEVTGDPLCLVGAPGCPHMPFTRQVETHGGHPRAQINFFAYEDRTLAQLLVQPYRGPPNDQVLINSDLLFEMDHDYNRFELTEKLLGFHSSSPNCTGIGSNGRLMKHHYTIVYGDPSWDWEPSTCQPAGRVTVSGSDQRIAGSTTATHAATVTAPADGSWTAYSNVPWITVLEQMSDSGTGTGARTSTSRNAATTVDQEVRYEVAANSGTERTGTLRIAGKLISVRQAGISFNDDPIVAGSTPVRAIHISELRTRIDVLRQREGLAAFPWTDNLLVPEVTQITAAHLSDLRTALQAAYEAAERTAPTYTDPAIAPGAVAIRAVHLTELRAAVVALEQPAP